MKRQRLSLILTLATALFFIACETETILAPGTTLETAITFLSAEETGGTSGTGDTTGLTLTFDGDPTTSLTADNIVVFGATRGTLTGSGTTRSLAISNITAANGETVSVALTSPSGFTISGSLQTAVVFRSLNIGMLYQGGVLAYILQAVDPGYVAGQTHGLIAATADQSTGNIWALPANEFTETGTAIGTGLANTNLIIIQKIQNGVGTSYAADLARDYNGGGYTDWYLPSKDELNKLYLNRPSIGWFEPERYWSSSEFDSISAWNQDFGGGPDGGQRDNFKYGSCRVRAVRAF